MMTDQTILQEQIAYYRARAQEYDESIQGTGRFAEHEKDLTIENDFALMMDAVHSLSPVESILELAAGTGVWTQALVKIGQTIMVVDASPEMLKLNRDKVGDARVQYIQADLFTWKPDQQYDLVLFGFWLSHVPPDRLDAFFDSVADAVRPGGRVVIIDQFTYLPGEEAITQGVQQRRQLADGSQFTIIKAYYDPADLREKWESRGFQQDSVTQGQYFFCLSMQRT